MAHNGDVKRWRSGGALLALAASLLPLACSGTRVRAAAGSELRAGKFLVASRDLRDPNFHETVVLLAQHDETSAMGLVVNRPTRVPLSELFPEFEPARDRTDAVHLGGPVLITGALALLRSATRPGESLRVLDDVYLLSTIEDLEKVVRDEVPSSRFRVYMGYAGWGPGQLEREIAGGSWHVFDGDADMVFDPKPGTVWERMIKRTDVILVRTFGWRRPGPA